MLPATISTAPLALMSMQSTLEEPRASAPLVMKTSAELMMHPQLEIVAVHEGMIAARTPTDTNITDASAAQRNAHLLISHPSPEISTACIGTHRQGVRNLVTM